MHLKNKKIWIPHLRLFQLSYIWLLRALYPGLDNLVEAGALFIPSALLPRQWAGLVLDSAICGSLFMHTPIFAVSTS